jgi:hypothetical protein
MEQPESSLPYSQAPATCQRKHLACGYYITFCFVSTSPNPQAGGPPLVGCLTAHTTYIRKLARMGKLGNTNFVEMKIEELRIGKKK